ncbi:hypothetical protein [Ralstonia sp. 24A2]|uniref:hypothetical protein n=1 Tax=Ralstonia sp. 24A2 TaxID=3447364 RepID=UPI003F697049
MVNASTPMERLVCQALIADDMFCADRGLDDTHIYMAPIAATLLRNDLGDSTMASLGRELLRQFLRDIQQAVAEEATLADAAIDTADIGERAWYRNGALVLAA